MTDYFAQRPQFDRDAELWTYGDCIEYLLDTFELTRSPARNVRLVDSALRQVMRDLPNKSRWSSYETRLIFSSASSYSTGSIEYEHAGGAFERLVTLTGGTFPTDARLYRIRIANIHYEIEEYKSATTITLPEVGNPGADVAAGTEFLLFKPMYPLPSDWRKTISLIDLSTKMELRYVEYRDIDRLQVVQGTLALPNIYTIRNAKEYYGALAIEFGPSPSTTRTYEMTYERSPRLLSTEKYTKGTVTTSGTTVTGTGTAFTKAHVGAVIRFSADSSNEPTGQVGTTDGLVNPFVEQRIVMARSSGTSLTIDSPLTSELTGVRYTISDPIDVYVPTMMTYVLRAAEMECARLMQRSDKGEYVKFAAEALDNAMASDNIAREQGIASAMVPFHLMPWSTIPTEVVHGQA